MEKNRNKRVFYVCFYSEREFADQIVTYPSVWSKIEYIIDVLKRSEYDVTVVSAGMSCNGHFAGKKIYVDDREVHKYFSSTKWKNSLLQKCAIAIQWGKILTYLLLHRKKDEKVIVYHSLFHRMWLPLYQKVFGKSVVLEVEDVFSELDALAERYKEKEWKMIRSADGCLFVNDIIREKVDVPSVISYGRYATSDYSTRNKIETIRLVYAGVIEQNRNAAFLAVKAMRFLADHHELHVLGFGDTKDIEALQEEIQNVNRLFRSPKVFFHGRMDGDEYSAFLQSCDVGLSTHMYDETSFSSADHTFPSKTLVYMANGLRVVAQRLLCLEKSALRDMIVFYDEPTPQSVANAIMRIDHNQRYDSCERIKQLDEKFVKEISELLDTV